MLKNTTYICLIDCIRFFLLPFLFFFFSSFLIAFGVRLRFYPIVYRSSYKKNVASFVSCMYTIMTSYLSFLTDYIRIPFLCLFFMELNFYLKNPVTVLSASKMHWCKMNREWINVFTSFFVLLAIERPLPVRTISNQNSFHRKSILKVKFRGEKNIKVTTSRKSMSKNVNQNNAT
jgi:hypothetical protein